MRFELFQRRTVRGKRWFWRLKARNGEIVCQSEAYHSRADAEHSIDLVQNLGPATPLKVIP
jgi:uncharacterized protein YegP (UPF0339 family)